MDSHGISSPAGFLEMVNAYRRSRIILTANELGVFSHLREGGDAGDDGDQGKRVIDLF